MCTFADNLTKSADNLTKSVGILSGKSGQPKAPRFCLIFRKIEERREAEGVNPG